MADFTITVQVDDNSAEVQATLKNAIERGLWACGATAEQYAKKKAPVDTGNLRNSITHREEIGGTSSTMKVGSDVEYAIYQELGTGKFVAGGRPTPWMYQDKKTGKWHWTAGNKAHPFIKPSVADNKNRFMELLRESLANA